MRGVGCLLLLLVAQPACGDDGAMIVGSDAAITADAEPMTLRGRRYCEILAVYAGTPMLRADVWNTADLNECPAADWEALDFNSIASELGALQAQPNGPRFWLVDQIVDNSGVVGETRTFGTLDMRLVASLPVDLGTAGMSYLERSVSRDTVFRFLAGREVYELTSAAGAKYRMQSYSHIADDSLTEASLSDLGGRLSLPQGWTFEARVLTVDDEVVTAGGEAVVIQDELTNTYQRFVVAP